jgi:hypothetical protein
MSAKAPACRANTKPGTAQLVCTKPTNVGESVSEVIAQPAATMCMNVPTFETNAVIHSDRYIAMRKGDHGPPVTFAETSPLIAPTLRLRKCYRIDIFPNSRAQLLQSRVIPQLVTKVIYGRFVGNVAHRIGEIIMYTLGYLLLAALLLGAVTTVVDSVLGTVQLSGIIKKIPIIGSNWGLIVAIAMCWLLKMTPATGWGMTFDQDWQTYCANGAIVAGMIPVKDAVISMVNKGFRM